MVPISLPSILVILVVAASVIVDGSGVCNVGGIRTDCCPGGCSSSQCTAKGCCWDPISAGIPWCFNSNPSVQGYRVIKVVTTPYGLEANLSLIDGNHIYGTDITPLHLSVWMETENRLRVKIFDPNNARWEVPRVVTSKPPSTKPSRTSYIFTYTAAPFGFAVQRASDSSVLFNTTTDGSFNGLIFEDQYLEISTSLPNNHNIYGLGEHKQSLKLQPHQYYTLFSADHGGTPKDINLYGVHPFYMDLRTGNAHGVFLLNSNGMDVYLGVESLTYRVIGGVLDFYFFVGPSPAEVIVQYTDLIGKPYMPPYWTLGWHQCRWGYNTLQDVETVVTKYAQNNIPLETMWTDIDYMYKYWDFTWDPVRFPQSQVQDFVDKLHANNQHYVVITDCGIANVTGYFAWDEGLKRGIFINDTDGKPFIGQVWPGDTAWPDFLNPATQGYWQDMLQIFLNTVPVDGIWVDMNEIDSFCDGECIAKRELRRQKSISDRKNGMVRFDPNNPPYAINNGGVRNPLDTKSIPMDTKHYGGVMEYNAHSLYGFTEANATRVALENITKKRAFVIGRSTFAGHGAHANHWLGDNYSDWDDLYYAIPGILSFNMFGIPLVGADICGFEGDTTEQLCARWMEVGVFYPFSRNHNAQGSVPQEPYVWPTVAQISANIIRVKYSLLPYYYTLFYYASQLGTTVARPLFFEFPTDHNTVTIDKQFLIGPALLISPVLVENANSVTAYFPGQNEVWYDFYEHYVVARSNPVFLPLDTPLDKIQLHLRGGYIIPTQAPSMTLAECRKNPFTLLVPLSVQGAAVGSLYLDDGESLNTVANGAYSLFNYTATTSANQQGGKLSGTVVRDGWSGTSSLTLASIDLFALNSKPSSLSFNGQVITNYNYIENSREVIVQVNAPINRPFTLQWQY